MTIDLHTHSALSDGTDSPSELLAAAERAGLSVIALCDHDTFDGLAEARAAARDSPVRLLPGIEISARIRGDSVHLLGYGCRTDDLPLARELVRVREGRRGRVPAMLAALARLGMPLEPSEVARFAGDSPSVGRPHIADAMVARGYVADRNEAFARYLADDGPAYVSRYATELATGIDLVHAAGGVAVIAHPWGRGAAARVTEALLAALVSGHGLDGIEVDHNDHSPADRRALRVIADRLGLLATGSSDYHGLGKLNHPLGCNTTPPGVLAEIERRIDATGGAR
jgi:predicted metal-dependent phosphoesterase TrpH